MRTQLRRAPGIVSVILAFAVNANAASIESLYGDGSAGSRLVTADETLNDAVLTYKSFTVETGATLTVRTGTIIRCTGKFTNRGTIVVEPGPKSRFASSNSNDMIINTTALTLPGTGVAIGVAGYGEAGNTAFIRLGGTGGIGVDDVARAREILRPGLTGGGAGAASHRADGGGGGGCFSVFARKGIANELGAVIVADGEVGGVGAGGGAGGLMILASDQSVVNAGTIRARGADGGSFTTDVAPGGGGGGGIVHLIGKAATNNGTVDVTAGSPGDPAVGAAITGTVRQGGGGGGACGGNGGDGGSVNINDTATAAQGGSAGHVIMTERKPSKVY